MASPGKDRKEEILGLLLMVLGLLVLLSVLPQPLARQFAPPPPPGAELTNVMGLAGKLLNESLKDLIGVWTYSLPLLLLAWGWRVFRGKPAPALARFSLFVALAGFVLMALASLAGQGDSLRSFDWSGGGLGFRLARYLTLYLGRMGAWTVSLVSLLVVLVVFTGLSLRAAAERVEGAAVGFGGALAWAARSLKPLFARKPRPAVKEDKKRAREAAAEKDKKEPPATRKTAGLLGKDAPAAAPKTAEEQPEDFEYDTEEEPETEPRAAENGSAKSDAGAVTPAHAAPVSGSYNLPPLDLLDPVDENKKLVSREELEKMGRVLIAKLADFGVEGELADIARGPQVSTFEIRPAPGVKVNRFSSLADDLAMAMRAKRIRIVAPIPGKDAVGVELPNPAPELVRAREVLDSEAFRTSALILPIALGKDLEGRIRVADLTRTPHLLIAGTTGSGKSVCMNLIISSLIFRYGPERVRLLMVDPKMIELNLYNDIPHLLHPVVTEAKEAARILKWAVLEMENRYRLLSRNSVRHIEDFNRRVASGAVVHTLLEGQSEAEIAELPYVVILVDELSDLMCSDMKNEIEGSLVRLAQMARAVGIHLVVATQRPSVDVITGLIKANFPSRLSFQVYSKIDSRTILDVSGAEQLLRNGDMLFMPAGQAEPIRIQGAYLSSEETERVVGHWRLEARRVLEEAGGAGEADDGLRHPPNILLDMEQDEVEEGGGDERDPLFDEAARLVVRHQQGSTSLIQRRLKVGYARAGRIVDQLERAGILGPPDGSKPREVLVSQDELEDYGVTG
ncbi:DNA translocase FtsK [bacterium]|nr:DNA translocase FtsK [bacterium]